MADLAVNHAERFVLRAGHTAERFGSDYGVDLTVHTFGPGGHLEPGEFNVQVKGSDKPRYLGGGKTVSVQVASDTLRLWLQQIFPLILVIYDARKDVAFWLYVQRHFEAHEQSMTSARTQNLRVPTSNILDDHSVSRFARWNDAVKTQLEGRLSHVSDL